MSAFEGLADAKRGFSSLPFQEGTYVVRIRGNDTFKSAKAGPAFAVRCEVVKVIAGALRVGECPSQIIRMKDELVAMQNIKSFLCAAYPGTPEGDIGKAVAEYVIGPAQPLAGLLMPVVVSRRISREGKKEDGTPREYLAFDWADAMSAEDIAATFTAEEIAALKL
jgi:hypothetical protein